jgi:hypothetical protein
MARLCDTMPFSAAALVTPRRLCFGANVQMHVRLIGSKGGIFTDLGDITGFDRACRTAPYVP